MSLMALVDYALILAYFLLLGLLVLSIGHSHTSSEGGTPGTASAPPAKKGEANGTEVQHHGQ